MSLRYTDFVRGAQGLFERSLPTSETKRIVCLANSRKWLGRCIAGKELRGNQSGPWVRPVSCRTTQELAGCERQYGDGHDPQVLDIIDVPILKHWPKSFQVENWLVDSQHHWAHIGQAERSLLPALEDHPACLWLNGSRTSRGLNDRISVFDSKALDSSLYFLHVDHMKVRVFAPGAYFGNPERRVQARFTYNVVRYRLWVTDPIVQKQYLAREDGRYRMGECFITVSLGEALNGYCYKLVASVIPAVDGRKSQDS